MIVHISMKTKLMKVSWKNLKLSVKIKIKFISPLYFAILLLYGIHRHTNKSCSFSSQFSTKVTWTLNVKIARSAFIPSYMYYIFIYL